MPKDGSAGYSLLTPAKQAQVADVTREMFAKCLPIFRKYPGVAHPRALYLDFGAGPGVVNGLEGSPLIAARTALRLEVPMSMYLFEKRRTSCRRLRAQLDALALPDWITFQIVPGDCNRTAERVAEQLGGALSGRPYGLLYADPNGLVPLDALESFARRGRFHTLDVLLHFDALVPRRINATQDKWKRQPPTREVWRRLRKKVMHLTEPEHDGNHDWTFSFHTNWEGLRLPSRLGFARRDSALGRLYEVKACEPRPVYRRAVAQFAGQRALSGVADAAGGGE